MKTPNKFLQVSLALFAISLGDASPGCAAPLSGLSFSPFFDGRDPNKGASVSESELYQSLQPLGPCATWVRFFGASAGLEHSGRLARALGFKVAVGAWLGKDPTANAAEIARVIAMANAGQADLVIVGSETLLRGDLTVAALVGYLRQVRAAVPANIPVATADTADKFVANPTLVAAVDQLLVNIYSFWRGIPIERALASLDLVYQQLGSVATGKKIVISESGWPSAGSPLLRAVPSDANAQAYLRSFLAWARARNVDYFYFEARSEPWKGAYEGAGGVGAHWGALFDRFGRLLPGRQSILDAAAPAPDTWTTSQPVLEPLSIPRHGSSADLVGLALGVNPSASRVVVYIRVGGGFWLKPYAAEPLTPIAADGVWSTDISTGGSDVSADRIVAFLVPATYRPPILLGAANLPTELSAFPKMELARGPSDPPQIAIQPQAQTILEGNTVSFSVVDTGAAPMTYQWRRNGAAIAGATAATLTLNSVEAAAAGAYTVVLSNGAGSVTSAAAALTVQAAAVPPFISAGPTGRSVSAGSSVTFSATATGTPPMSFQWLKAGLPISGATDSVLALAVVQPGSAGAYAVRVSNTAGSVVSLDAILSVGAATGIPTPPLPPTNPATPTQPAPPRITTAPVDVTVKAGAAAIFPATVAGDAPLQIAWERNGTTIPGATSATLTLASVSNADAGTYTMKVSNAAGSVSARVTLTVLSPPTMAATPANRTARIGDTTSLSVSASGTAPLTYQWLKDGVPLAGATGATLVFPAVRLADAGAYMVRIENVGGRAESPAAMLTVSDARLANLAVLGLVADGSSPIIGFVVSPGGGKPVLVRGIGPALAEFGVPGALSDPVLTLFSPRGDVVASNASWGTKATAPLVARAGTEVGAFPLTDGSRDAAVLPTLAGGAYSALFTSRNATGLALLEVYDAASGEGARLINLSARARVGPAGEVLIVGFVVRGSEPLPLLIRAVGPGLSPFGVPERLADPILTIYAGDRVRETNDSWNSGPNAADIATRAAQVGAFALASGSRDAAVFSMFNPGAYTAHVNGVGGTGGVVLVEVYEVP